MQVDALRALMPPYLFIMKLGVLPVLLSVGGPLCVGEEKRLQACMAGVINSLEHLYCHRDAFAGDRCL